MEISLWHQNVLVANQTKQSLKKLRVSKNVDMPNWGGLDTLWILRGDWYVSPTASFVTDWTKTLIPMSLIQVMMADAIGACASISLASTGDARSSVPYREG